MNPSPHPSHPVAVPAPAWATVACVGFPLVGDAHPVRRRERASLMRGFTAALILHLALGGSLLIDRADIGRPPMPGSTIVVTQLPPPPSVRGRDAPLADPSIVIQRGIGVPEPVPDFQVPDILLAENRFAVDLARAQSLASLTGAPGDTLIIDLDRMPKAAPAPAEFDAVEEKPSVVSFPAPVYPELARHAEVEGRVLLRLLVGADGRVKDAAVVEGVAMLNAAALEAARGAIFRPALQQHRPVAVWVEVPVQFRLHD